MATRKKIYKLSEIKQLLTEDQLKVASGMIADAEFMQKQLADLRKRIKKDGVDEQYQYGSKQTAAMTTYLQIQKQYGVIIKYLTELIPSQPSRSKNDELLEFLKDN